MTRARDVASNGGLVLVGSSTFSAQSSVSFNNVFSSTYNNYVIFCSVPAVLYIQLSLNGTPSSASYGYSSHYMDYNGATGAWSNSAGTSATSAFIANTTGMHLNIFNPSIATTTTWNAVAGNGGTNGYVGGSHNISTAYDGIKFFPSSGTITGTIRIYGMRN